MIAATAPLPDRRRPELGARAGGHDRRRRVLALRRRRRSRSTSRRACRTRPASSSEPLLLTEATASAARGRATPSSCPRGAVALKGKATPVGGVRARRNAFRTPHAYNGGLMSALTRPFRRRLRRGATPPRPSARGRPRRRADAAPVEIAPDDPLLAYFQGVTGAGRHRHARARLAGAARAQGERASSSPSRSSARAS